MIRIIRHGNKKRLVCTECSCIFTYERDDIIEKEVIAGEIDSYILCPDCGERIEVRND